MLFGKSNPVSQPSYTHKVVYRAVVPIADGIAALGEDKANNQCTHMGPDAHIVSFPVSLTPDPLRILKWFGCR